MSDTSRRKFIAVAGAGAAAGTVGSIGLAGPASASARLRRDGAREALVAHVPDHAGDRVVLHVGEREVVVRDRDLVTRLLNAAGGN